MNNDERAEEAHWLLGQQADAKHNDLETNIVDLVTNLRHLCKREGVIWADCLKTAAMHFRSEQ